jgi:hypothetical protein
MTKQVKEGLGDLANAAERDHEVQMARADLYKLAKYAIKLHDMLKTVSEAQGIEGWQQAKITKAADYISSVYHALDYDMKFAESKSTVNVLTRTKGVIESNYTAKLATRVQETIKKKISLTEKAVSQNQQKAAGIALSHKKKDTKPPADSASASMMNMSVAELEKIAGTKHKGLPDTVGESAKNICTDCGKPSFTTLGEEKQKGVDGKVCWKGYKRMGTKKKGDKTVDNCVKM